MRKFGAYFESLCLAFFINFAVLIMRPFAFCIIENDLINADFDKYLSCFSYLIIYCAVVFCVSIIVRSCGTNQSVSQFSKTYFLKILPLSVGVRLLCDLVLMLLFPSGSVFTFALEYVCIFAVFSVACKFQSKERPRLDVRYKICLSICLLMSACFVVLHFVYSSCVFEETALLESKYIDTTFIHKTDTVGFNLQIINMLFSFFVWLSCFVWFGILSAKARIYSEYEHWRTPLAKYLAWITICWAFMGVKLLCLPHGCFKTSAVINGHSTSYVNAITVSDRCVETFRLKNYTESELVYRKYEYELKYKDRTVKHIIPEYNRDRIHMEKLDIIGTEEAWRFDFFTIAYVSDGDLFVIDFDEINGYEDKNDVLLEICKNLIDDGYFRALEYSYEYLERFDSDYLNEIMDQIESDGVEVVFWRDVLVIQRDYEENIIRNIK